ncbi:MAG: aspartate carbamoyltransferase catalytic subunit [Sulfurovaceae bacterium]|jgi:aspartate carbamoyltransferase catalytic subunit|nr:aspartate carbamoyltransferase catalytic subunit [Sulfurovaceae bacterium]
MQHLITTDNFSAEQINNILQNASRFKNYGNPPALLRDKLLFTLFFENSTRTRSSFEVAAKKLGAAVVHLDPSKSSTSKGETIEDTFANLGAMAPDGVIIRHASNEIPQALADMNMAPIINAGAGNYAHPTQGLLDLFTLQEHFGSLEGKRIAIVGDIANSRVASSAISLLPRFGVEVSLVAPAPFMPTETKLAKYDNLQDVIDNVDAIMSLRAQLERHKTPIFDDYETYASHFCITPKVIGDRDIIIMHPGPVMRNIDISDEVLNDARCKVLTQVSNGVFVRMAVLKMLLLDS